MHRFIAENLVSHSTVELTPEQSHHLLHVLRLKTGQLVELFDGRGITAQGILVDELPTGCHVQIQSLTSADTRSRITLAFGYTKGPAFDFIVRKGTEIGVAAFQPLFTAHSLRINEWNANRWTKVISEVGKQCQETTLPTMNEPKKIDSWLTSREPHNGLIFCHESKRDSTPPFFAANANFDLLVGAEGGWSAEETDRILKLGAVPLGLGKNRLRAETAALVALTLLKSKVGEI